MEAAAFEAAYRAGELEVPELDEYFVHDRCMRESGHDTSYRLEGRCADLVTVDLNSLLYRMESDIAETIGQEFGGRLVLPDGKVESRERWAHLAERRRSLINRYLWNAARGMYFDFDHFRNRPSDYVSATTLYPLWAGAASKEQAESLVRKALPQLEMPGGIVSSTVESRGLISAEHPLRQWDYPYGWAPHQILTWLGLTRYG